MRTTGANGGLLVGLCAAALFAGAACSSADDEHLGTSSAAGMTAFANDQTAYDYFRAKGFTNFQAAGIVGNLDQESGLDPTISQQGGGPGRGIAQWSAGGRWDTDPGDNLVAFAAQENQSPDSLGVQLDFIMFELQNFPDYGLAALQATTNVTDATTDFELNFEGCDIADECDGPSRIAYAQSVLAAYGNDPVDVDAGGGDAATPSEDAGEAGESDDSGTANSGSPDAAPHAGDDAGAAAAPVDASAPQGSSSGSTSSAAGGEDGGGSGAAGAAATSQGSSGCAVATAGMARETPARWLVAVSLILGFARRRRLRESGASHRTRLLPRGLLRRPTPRELREPPGRTAKEAAGTLRA